MRGQSLSPPPASPRNAGHDPRNVRHSCGTAYNGYVWGRCPQCEADERQLYALGCYSCGSPFFSAERVDHCPECGSGETTIVAEPADPAVR